MERGGSSGCGGRGGGRPFKRAANDDEAGSSRGPARPPVDPTRSAQARARGALSRGHSSRWAEFHRIGDLLWPAVERKRDASRAFIDAKEAVAAGGEGAGYRLTEAQEEYDFADVLLRSALEFHLGHN